MIYVILLCIAEAAIIYFMVRAMGKNSEAVKRSEREALAATDRALTARAEADKAGRDVAVLSRRLADIDRQPSTAADLVNRLGRGR